MEWAEADIRSADLVRLFEGLEAVVHLAWLIQPSRDERETGSVNVAGSNRLFEAGGCGSSRRRPAGSTWRSRFR